MGVTINQLEQRLGYEFKDKKLAVLALSHRSFGKQNNERLEFLGDSIVNFVIADALYRRFCKAKEGQLSRLRARMVCGRTLAEIAREFELGQFLYLGSGELKSGGRERDSILADTVEALIGAIYLDSNIEMCHRCIISWFSTRLAALAIDDYTNKDSKTRLQEHLQSQHKPLPLYELTNIRGKAHEQVFSVTCSIEGIQPIVGEGGSRRGAEQFSAQQALIHLKVTKDKS